MTGLVGIIGAGTTAELHRMAARMTHRGRLAHTWNPAPQVLYGLLGHGETSAGEGALALDASGNLYPGHAGLESTQAAAELLERQLRSDPRAALLGLRGSFALAYWDERDGSVLLATDRHGYKCLYFVQLPGRIAFASEYKALLALDDCPAEVDRAALQTYLLTLHCPSERALLMNVKRLCSARTARLYPGRCELQRYWVRERGDLGMGFADAARELRRRLEGALRGMTAGHSRAGITLSGGLDSVALLGLTRHVRPDLVIGTHTIGHGADDPEIIGAQHAAEHFQTEHHPVTFDAARIPGLLPGFVWSTEDLMGREETLLLQEITRELATRERLFIAGNGADLAFCGMPRHRLLWLRDRAPWPLRSALEELLVYTQTKRPPATLSGRLLRFVASRGDVPDAPRVPGEPFPEVKGDYTSLAACQRDTIAEWSFDYHERIDAELGLIMACPYSDADVMEFALQCPMDYLIDRRSQKRILRAAVADLLPPALVERRKRIQRLNHDAQLAEVIENFADSLHLDTALEQRQLVAPGYVRRLRRRGAGRAYSQGRMHMLWPLLCAEIWMRQFVDHRGASPPAHG